MQCPKCRASMPNGARYCTECGAKLPSQPDSVPNVAQPIIRETAYNESPSVGTEAPPVTAQGARPSQNAPVKLGWFKFLTKFSLWASAVANIANAVQFFTGSELGTSEEVSLMYSFFPMMKVLNIFYGLLALAYAAFAIYTRYRLAQFRKNGPACLYTLFAAELVMAPIYLGIASLILGQWLGLTDVIGQTLVSAIFLWLNVVYFRKRQHLFCH